MKEVNCYYKRYEDKGTRSDFLKYGLCNEYGPNLECYQKQTYNEENIIKRKCNLKKKN